MKKIIIIATIIFLSFIPIVTTADSSFQIEKVTIDAQIDENGVMHVRELYTYAFDGSFEGVSRAIDSDVSDFKAYLAKGDQLPTDISSLEKLVVEKDDGTFKVYSNSVDERKYFLYEYKVKGIINRYTDIADFTYAFFDSSNDTDLHQMDIYIHTPHQNVTEDTHFFLHDDEAGELTITDSGVHYYTEVLEEGEDSFIRGVFPANQLSNQVELKKDQEMLDTILAEEKELAERQENLAANSEKMTPILWGLMALTAIIAIYLIMKHPARYRGDKSEDALLREVERTDPLFVKFLESHYLDSKGYLIDNSFLAGLISLKQRGVVTLEEVPSERKPGETTIRFTWHDTEIELDMADHYLYSWLFKEKDEQGEFFLLETLTQNKEESDKEQVKKAEEFRKHFKIWSEMVLQRESYQNIRKRYRFYPWLSNFFIIITFGLFYVFTTYDPISNTAQQVLPIVIGSLALISILTSRWKWVSVFYFPIVLFVSLIAFSFNLALILSLGFYFMVFILLIATPAYYYSDNIKRLKYAITQAKVMFYKEKYPVDANPEKLERRLEYAIVLGQGKKYGNRCGKLEFTEKISPNLPLLNNPNIASTSLNYTNIVLFTATVGGGGSNSSSSPSSTGGGGAGAF